MTNEQKYKNLRKRNIIRIVMIILTLATIVLAMLSLIIGLNSIYAIIVFVIEMCLARYRNNIKIK